MKHIRDKILNSFDIYELTSSINEMSIQVNSKRVSKLISEHGLVANGTRKFKAILEKGKRTMNKKMSRIEFFQPMSAIEFGLAILPIFLRSMVFNTWLCLLIFTHER